MNPPTAGPAPAGRLAFEGGAVGSVEVAPGERRLRVAGVVVPLGSRAFDLLAALIARRDRVVPKDELIDAVWPGLVVEDNNLQVQVSALRKVLGAPAIVTVPGRGYQFTLPEAALAVPDGAVFEREPAPLVARAARVARLLVVDDNKVNRLLLTRALQLLGHEVENADSGERALEALHRRPFDLLLLDLQMPGIDGFDLLERRAAEPVLRELPVIVTSSVEGVAPVARCIELGADDFLPKPVNPTLLRARVDSSLERKFLRDRLRERLARLDPVDADADADADAAPHCAVMTVLVATLHGSRADDGPGRAAATLELLDAWTTLMLDAVEEHGGRLQRADGDCLAAVFGDAAAATRTAREMVALTAQLDTERAGAARPAGGAGRLTVAIGIATGELVAGTAGRPRQARRLHVGAPVHRAGRLAELAADDAATPILVDAPTHAAAGGTDAAPRTSLRLPGEPAPVPVHAWGRR